MTEVPNMMIHCDHVDCQLVAVAIAHLTHMRTNQCKPQSVALCDSHVDAWKTSLKGLQDALDKEGPVHCPNCQTPLPENYVIGTITELKGTP